MMFICDLIRLDMLVALRCARDHDPSIAILDCIEILKRLGATRAKHSQGGLLPHLIGTASILASWNCPLETILAGLYHTVYGTPSYSAGMTVSRDVILETIGKRA